MIGRAAAVHDLHHVLVALEAGRALDHDHVESDLATGSIGLQRPLPVVHRRIAGVDPRLGFDPVAEALAGQVVVRGMTAALGPPGVDVAGHDDRVSVLVAGLDLLVSGRGLGPAQPVEALFLAQVAAVPLVEVDRDEEEVLTRPPVLELSPRAEASLRLSVGGQNRKPDAARGVPVGLAGGLFALGDQPVPALVIEQAAALRATGLSRVCGTRWFGRPGTSWRPRSSAPSPGSRSAGARP